MPEMLDDRKRLAALCRAHLALLVSARCCVSKHLMRMNGYRHKDLEIATQGLDARKIELGLTTISSFPLCSECSAQMLDHETQNFFFWLFC